MKPIVLLTFERGHAELLCSKQLKLLRAHQYVPEATKTAEGLQDLLIVSDYKSSPEGYSCFGQYYIIEHAEIGCGLTLETSAGIYQWN